MGEAIVDAPEMLRLSHLYGSLPFTLYCVQYSTDMVYRRKADGSG